MAADGPSKCCVWGAGSSLPRERGVNRWEKFAKSLPTRETEADLSHHANFLSFPASETKAGFLFATGEMEACQPLQASMLTTKDSFLLVVDVEVLSPTSFLELSTRWMDT